MSMAHIIFLADTNRQKITDVLCPPKTGSLGRVLRIRRNAWVACCAIGWRGGGGRILLEDGCRTVKKLQLMRRLPELVRDPPLKSLGSDFEDWSICT
jgi:hypothetical protein